MRMPFASDRGAEHAAVHFLDGADQRHTHAPCGADHDKAHIFVGMTHMEKAPRANINRGSFRIPEQSCARLAIEPTPRLAGPLRGNDEGRGFLLHRGYLVNSSLGRTT